jgi:hypothetical protein
MKLNDALRTSKPIIDITTEDMAFTPLENFLKITFVNYKLLSETGIRHKKE